eukprot:TRINITY_DN1823_c0_g1_i4.p1 TRINITY_DN1823_c0_g1~~TRINITY_DN1823_c0_g1_i4.p1  ORF type:complete len:3344 (-),score=945.09 TRINITY_DN1823_c0_g1_i4:44-10075(-)
MKQKLKTSPNETLIETLKKADDSTFISTISEFNKNLEGSVKLYKKDDIENWSEVIKKLEVLLQHVKSQCDESVSLDDGTKVDIITPKPTFDKGTLSQILTFLKFILQTCRTTKGTASIVENLVCPLVNLNTQDFALIVDVLKLLSTFVKKTATSRRLLGTSSRVTFGQAIQSQLNAIAQGWSGKEAGLTIARCCDEEFKPNLPLHFEYYVHAEESKPEGAPDSKAEASPVSQKGGHCIIHVDNIASLKETPLEILLGLVQKFKIPKEYHLPLFARIRLSKNFPNPEMRKHLIAMRLLAFTILAQSHNSEMVFLVTNILRSDPEFLSELVEAVQTDQPVPEEIRILCVKSITALVSEGGPRLASVILATGCSSYGGPLPATFRKVITAITNGSSDKSYSIQFLESLFTLVSALAATTTGAAALKNSGIFVSLIPLLNYRNEGSATILSNSIGMIETFIDYDDTAIDLFRDLEGLEILLQRLSFELEETEKRAATPDSTPRMFPASGHKLIKSVFRAISICLQGQRLTSGPQSQLLQCLLRVFTSRQSGSGVFSPSVFLLAMNTMTSMMQNEPTSYPSLASLSIPDMFLKAIASPNLPPSVKVISAIPTALSALCLSTDGLAKVTEVNPLPDLLSVIYATKFASVANKAAISLGMEMDELLRHHPSLKTLGIDAVVQVLERVVNYDGKSEESTKNAMELEGQSSSDRLVLQIDAISKFLQEFFANGDYGDTFIERRGLDLLLGVVANARLPINFIQTSTMNHLAAAHNALGIRNVVAVMNALAQRISDQFKNLDKAVAWRETNSLVKNMEKSPEVHRAVNVLHCYIAILGGFLGNAAEFNTNVTTTLTVWTSDAGMETCLSLGQLQRALIWEIGTRVYIDKIPIFKRKEGKQESTDKNSAQEKTPAAATDANADTTMKIDEAATPAAETSPKRNDAQEEALQLISGIHSLSKGMSQALTLNTRRRAEEKTITSVLQTLAKVLSQHLSWTPQDYKPSDIEKSAYLASVIGELRSLLFDGFVIHTMLLNAIENIGGLNDLFKDFSWLANTYLDAKSKGESLEKDHPLVLALASIARILANLVHGDALLNAATTANMLTQSSGGKGPFDPHAFVKNLQKQALGALLPFWNEKIEQFPAGFHSGILSAVGHILEGESPTTTSRVEKPVAPSFQPDPSVVSQLVDMGFSSKRSEEALRQIGSNNVQNAMDWLLSNPEPEFETLPTFENPDNEEDDELAMALAMSLNKTPSEMSASSTDAPATTTTENMTPSPPSEYDQLKNTLVSTSFGLLSDDTAANVADLFVRFSKRKEDELLSIAKEIVAKIKSCTADISRSPLLSPLITIITTFAKDEAKRTKIAEALEDLVPILIDILERTSKMLSDDAPANPDSTALSPTQKLLWAALAAIDVFVSLYQPKGSVPVTSSSASSTTSAADRLAPTAEQQRALLDVCLRVVKAKRSAGIPPLIAAHTMLSHLTRDFDLAMTFLHEGGVEALLNQNQSPRFGNQQILVANVTRHVIEDRATLQSSMEAEIAATLNALTGRNAAKVTVRQLVTTLAPVICRNPAVFVDALANTCCYASGTTNVILISNFDPKNNAVANRERSLSGSGAAVATAMSPAKSLSSPAIGLTSPGGEKAKTNSRRVPPNLKQVMDILTNELVLKAKNPGQSATPNEGKEGDRFASSVDILNLLADYVLSYAACSHVIMRHQFGKNVRELTTSSNVIHFVLSEILPYAHTSSDKINERRQGENLTGTKMLASVCARPEGRRKVITEIVHHLDKKSDDEKWRAPTIHSLADVLYLLLTSRTSGATSSEIGKLMLELDAVKVLVNALKTVDLDCPEGPEIVNAILKPLEHLTRLNPQAAGPVSANSATGEAAPATPQRLRASSQQSQDGAPVEELVLDPIVIDESVHPLENDEEDDDSSSSDVDDEEDPMEGEIEEIEGEVVEEDEENEEGGEEGEDGEDEGENEEEEEQEEGEEAEDYPEDQQVSENGNAPAEEDNPAREAGLRILNDIFPGFDAGEANAASPFVFVSGNARDMEDDVRRLFGRAVPNRSRGGMQRWTDDGSKPTAEMMTLAQSYEPLIAAKLGEVTVEQEAKKKEADAANAPTAENTEKKEEPAKTAEPATTSTTSQMDTTEPVTDPMDIPTPEVNETPASTPAATSQPAPVVSQPAPPPQPAPEISQPSPAMSVDTPATEPVSAPAPPVAENTAAAPAETTAPVTTVAEPSGPSSGTSAPNSAIDPTFLEALPEELRFEVLASQLGQSLGGSGPNPPAPGQNAANTSTLNPDFLAALPPDIQAEVLEQERHEMERAQREAAAAAADTSLAEDMDNASFIATLPPELREEVLLSQDENFIATLPPQLAAEAQALRERAYRNRYSWRRDYPPAESEARAPGPNRPGLGAPTALDLSLYDRRGKALVEPNGLVALIRLLYVQQALSKATLHRLFYNLCTNESTRIYVLQALVWILSSFGNLTERNNSSEKSLKNATDLKELLSSLHAVSPQSNFSVIKQPSHSLLGFSVGLTYTFASQSKAPPLLVSRRILEIVIHLVKNSPLVSELMLKNLTGMLQGISEKEQGFAKAAEEVQLRHSPFEEVLRLLGIPEFHQNPSNLEYSLSILANAVKVLKSFAKKKQEIARRNEQRIATDAANANANPPATSESSSNAPVSNVPSETSTSTTVSTSTSSSSESTAPKEPEKFEKEKEPSCPRVPRLLLRNLAGVLTFTSPTCSEAAYKNAVAVMEFVISNVDNQEDLFRSLLERGQQMADIVKSNLDSLKSQLEKAEHPATVLSASSSVELNLLRILKAILLLRKDPSNLSEASLKILEVENFATKFEPLWESFETFLASYLKTGKQESASTTGITPASTTGITRSASSASQSSSLTPSLSPLLPLIEAFFLSNSQSVNPARISDQSTTGPPLTSSTSSLRISRFLQFSEQNRRLLNDLIKQNPSLLEDSFAILISTNPMLIDFENKRSFFRTKIQKLRNEAEYHGEVRLSVRRSQVFEDSFYQLRTRTKEELKGRLTVHFVGEEGIDAGGVSREWYVILAKEMFNPNYCLFLPSPDGAFQPNKNSDINQDHIAYFKFTGRVIGKALMDGQLMDAHFTRSFYKHILKQPVNYQDMEAIDPEYFKNLKWILDNDITDILDLNFTSQQEEFGVLKLVELKPGGKNIPVTNENKDEYVRLITEFKMTTAIRPQINGFLEGFQELIDHQLVSIFTPSELELLISGLPDIDIDDLRKNTEYRGYTIDSPTVQWWWQVISEFGQEEKALLLQFVTGTSKVPLEGFKALQGMSGPQKFQIYKSYEKDKLPTAHTCFNQIDLPEYTSIDELRRCLLIALREGSEGFAFG